MIQVLLFMVVVIFVVGAYISIRLVHGIQVKSVQSDSTSPWDEVTKVQDLIALYLDIILVHGPDSQEAKSFRFGVDNSELWKGNEGLEFFITMTKICDNAVGRHRTFFRRKR